MNNTMPDPAEPIGNVTIVKDFLPPVNQLVPKQKTVTITMEFTQKSIEFFKREAKRRNSSYQEMISNLVDAYAKQGKV
ncbi:hypothetical protein [Pseudanabaena minima]|uniref:hypothetical protein n=1 Tax=Pseudanabaena minima TaxID=890415 RepID=UPI003DA8707D